MKDFLHFFAQLLYQIPATLWGVVIGSLFTLTGVYLTNRAADRRLNREREMTFRRDIYVAAAAAISVSMNALSKFSDLSFSPKEVSAMYIENSPALTKVNLVAGEDTIRALANFGTEFAGAFFRLTQQRMALNDLQEQIATKAALLRGFEQTRDAMIELMRHHNIDGVQDPRRFEAIQRNYEFEADRIETTNQELQLMIAELSARHTPFRRECSVESARISQLFIPLLVAARKELGIPISKEQYAEIFHQAQSKQGVQIDNFFKNVAAVNAEAPTP